MEKQYFSRFLEQRLVQLVSYFPATVLVGPRQVGKTSLVQALRNQLSDHSIYLDLERPSDLQAVSNLELFTESHPESLIIFDEVQRRPGLFTELRSIIDRDRRPGRFLLLGSASFDLIRDASETLAGRIAIEELTGLRLDEVDRHASITEHWLRGGFPDALLVPDDDLSLLWRENLIRTYVERDVPSYGVQAGPALLRRLLTMVAHLSGQQLNVQSLSNSLQLNGRTVENTCHCWSKPSPFAGYRPITRTLVSA